MCISYHVLKTDDNYVHNKDFISKIISLPSTVLTIYWFSPMLLLYSVDYRLFCESVKSHGGLSDHKVRMYIIVSVNYTRSDDANLREEKKINEPSVFK